MYEESIRDILLEGAELKRLIASTLISEIQNALSIIINALQNKGRLFLIGNGGSAADAQHIAAELIGRFKYDRGAVPAIALTTDTSIITAIGNDYDFQYIFSRQIDALVTDKDVVIAISTSGNSQNIIKGVLTAKAKNAKTIGFLGKEGGKLKDIVDTAIVVPSANTARIQEVHITLGHLFCELIEKQLRPSNKTTPQKPDNQII